MRKYVCNMKKFRYITVSKKSIICACLLIATLVLSTMTMANADYVINTASQNKKLPIYCTTQTEKKASLSFDAAWGNEDTQELINILAKYNVKATFFVVGEWVDKYPKSVKALSDAGHEIMNHSDTHPDMVNISKEEMSKEIESCNDKIEKVTGKRPILFRAPYGSYNNTLIDCIEEKGMYCIQWDVDSLDWKDYSADKIYNRVTGRVKEGSICLFHNAAKHTPEALPSIIEKLQSDGYTLVPISELIYKGEFTLDHEGRQIPAVKQTTITTTAKAS